MFDSSLSADRQTPPCAAGVLVAAGRGRRLGGGKQLLPWGDTASPTTLVASAFDSIAGFCRRMVVVLGADAQAVAAALSPRRFVSVLADPDAEMIVSIQVGLAAARATFDASDVLLQLSDHPEVSVDTLRTMLAEAARHPDRAVIPTYRGRGGHPVWIPNGLATRLSQMRPTGGLRAVWRSHPELCCRLPVDDPRVVCDMDTLQDLLRSARASEPR